MTNIKFMDSYEILRREQNIELVRLGLSELSFPLQNETPDQITLGEFRFYSECYKKAIEVLELEVKDNEIIYRPGHSLTSHHVNKGKFGQAMIQPTGRSVNADSELIFTRERQIYQLHNVTHDHLPEYSHFLPFFEIKNKNYHWIDSREIATDLNKYNGKIVKLVSAATPSLSK